jgi:hypothetical protein
VVEADRNEKGITKDVMTIRKICLNPILVVKLEENFLLLVSVKIPSMGQQ